MQSMQEIPINEEQGGKKILINVLSIYTQDLALGTSLEPLEKMFLLFVFSKMHNFSHSLKIIDEDGTVDSAFHDWDTFIGKEKASSINSRCIYKYTYRI